MTFLTQPTDNALFNAFIALWRLIVPKRKSAIVEPEQATHISPPYFMDEDEPLPEHIRQQQLDAILEDLDNLGVKDEEDGLSHPVLEGRKEPEIVPSEYPYNALVSYFGETIKNKQGKTIFHRGATYLALVMDKNSAQIYKKGGSTTLLADTNSFKVTRILN